MSTTVDQRIVEMRFDNKQFEANVSTTMSSLDKLKAKLNFSGVSKSLLSINDSAKKVDLNPISKAVENVSVKFSSMQVIATTALVNITNSAIAAGKNIISALTIDPVKTGFQEYETQINAIQTILANTQSKGSTLEDVNKALDELNKYADMTIYNFTEMTRNIGTFTAAGVDLEKSVTSIKGIANLAAISGSTAQQASTAMYQLSQALAAGKVQLMDWNSVVNAGMGGEVFQTALKRTATQMGQNVDMMIEKYGSFRESLTKGGWLTAEVLTETLTQLSGAYTEADLIAQGYSEEQAKQITELAQTAVDAATKVKTFTQLFDTLKEAAQSGWTNTWELIIGDFEESREFLTNLSDLFGGIINASAEARNNLLKGALTSKWSQLTDEIEAAGVATEDFNSELEKTVESHGHNVGELIDQYGSLEKAFSKGALSSDLIVETLKNMSSATGEVGESTENLTDKLEHFQKVVDEVWQGSYKNGEERIKALTEAGYDYAEVQNLVNKTVDGHRLTLEDLSDTQLESIGYTDEQIEKINELAKAADEAGTPLNDLIKSLEKPSGRELLLEGVMNIINGIVKALGAVKQAWNETFAITSEQLYNLIEGFNNLSKTFIVSDDAADKIRRTFKGLFAVLDIITTILGGGFKLAISVISKLLGMANVDILTFTAALGDAVSAFRDFLFENNVLAKGFNKTIELFGDSLIVIKDLVKSFLELSVVQDTISDFQFAFGNAFKNISDHLESVGERFESFLRRVKQLDGITLDNVGMVLKDFWNNVVKYFFNIDGVFDDVKLALKNFEKNFREYFQKAGDSVDNLVTKIVNFAITVREKFNENIGLGELLAVGLGVGIILVAKKIGDALEVLSGPISGFTDVLSGLSNVLNAYTTKLKAEALFTVSKAIAVLAASVALLAFIDQKKVWSSVGALAALSVVLVALSTAIGKIGGKLDNAKGSVSLLALASAVLVLALAMKQFDQLNADRLVVNLGILGGLMAALLAVAIAMGKFAPQLSTGSIFLVSFAVSIKVLAGALQEIEKINPDTFQRSMTILILAMGSLAGLSIAAKGLSAGAALSILAISVSLRILIKAFNDISELDAAKVKGNIEAFVTIFGMFALLMVSSKFAGANAAKAGLGIIAMSAALILIIQAFKMISAIDPYTLDRATEAVSKLLLVFGAVVALSNFAGANAAKAGAMILMMSGALLAISVVLVILSKIDPDGLDRAVGAVAALELIFGVLIATSKLAGDAKGTIMALTVSLGLLAVAVAALSFVDPDNLERSTACIVAMIGAFSVLVASTKLIQKSTSTIIIMSLVIGELAGIIFLLSTIPADSAISAAASMSMLLLSLSASFAIISKSGQIMPTAYASIGVMLLTVTALGAIIGALAYFELGSTLEIAASLSVLLLSLSASCLILAGVGATGPAALIGAGVLDGVILAIGALMVGIGALATYYPGLQDFLDTGIVLLEKIGYGIGSVLGNVIGGFTSGITAGLPAIAMDLSLFMGMLTPFLDGAKSISEDSVNGVKSIADMILTLSAASVMDGIASLFGGGSSMTKFATELVPFGQAMSDFSKSIEGLDTDLVNNAAIAGRTLAEMAATLPNSGGVLGFFAGENNMEDFAKQLVVFGRAMVQYGNAVVDLDSNAVTNSATAGKAVAELAANLPNSGGALGFFAGNNDMEQFAKQLVPFGRALKNYADEVAGLDTSAISTSASAGKMVMELADMIPNSGGALGFFVGNNNMDTFGKQLVLFGKGIKQYANEIKDLDTGAIATSNIAAQSLINLAESIPNWGGLVTLFTGGNDMDTFRQQLMNFGVAFRGYADSLSGIDASAVSASANVANALVNLQNGLPKDGGIFSSEETLDAVGDQLVRFGTSFNTFYNSIRTVDIEQLNQSVASMKTLLGMFKDATLINPDTVESFVSAMKELGDTGINSFTDSFTRAEQVVKESANRVVSSYAEAIRNSVGLIQIEVQSIVNQAVATFNINNVGFYNAGYNALNQFIQGGLVQIEPVRSSFKLIINTFFIEMRNRYEDFRMAGQEIINRMILGFNDKAEPVKTTFADLVDSSVETIRSEYQSFYDAGAYLVQGFANAIDDNTYLAEARSRAMAKAAADAARAELDINSPSRVSYEIGDYYGQGFIKALTEYKDRAYNASYDMANYARYGLTNAINKISNLIDSGMDVEPTIRPVLDLSELKTGVGQLNAMFSGKQAVAVSGQVRKRMSAENQNGTSVSTPSEKTVQFVQNNYSPKALSRVEIYRQTKNQLAMIKEAVK